jgi:hypothetical protein
MNMLFVWTGFLLAFSIGPAKALWLEAHIKPGANENYERNFQVKVKDDGRWKVYEVTVTPHTGAKELRPLEFSKGRVYRSPDKTKPSEARHVPHDASGIIVPATAKWSKNSLTYKFRVPAGKLSWVRFEYWDSDAHTPGELAGGTHYWFNLFDPEQEKEIRDP